MEVSFQKARINYVSRSTYTLVISKNNLYLFHEFSSHLTYTSASPATNAPMPAPLGTVGVILPGPRAMGSSHNNKFLLEAVTDMIISILRCRAECINRAATCATGGVAVGWAGWDVSLGFRNWRPWMPSAGEIVITKAGFMLPHQ